jgi:predicted O-methyltransferase YrrM
MKYKFYFRKSSFKKDIGSSKKLLDLVVEHRPKNILEIGVLEGATSRNFCEALTNIHGNDFSYTGIDLFGLDLDLNNEKEFTPVSNKFSNPFKYLYFKYILKCNPNSIKSVRHLLKKFTNSISLHQGYSEKILLQLDLSNTDFIFLDGGHSYETVKKDLFILIKKLKKNSIIVCDDYNIFDYGVKKAVDEIKNKYYFKDLKRFALIKT